MDVLSIVLGGVAGAAVLAAVQVRNSLKAGCTLREALRIVIQGGGGPTPPPK